MISVEDGLIALTATTAQSLARAYSGGKPVVLGRVHVLFSAGSPEILLPNLARKLILRCSRELIDSVNHGNFPIQIWPLNVC